MMAVIQMSDRDLARLRTLIDLVDGQLTMDSAAAGLEVSDRHVSRLLTSFPDEANAGDVANSGQQSAG
jgi:hypothetical protein